jgi:WD40 repeat protein
MGSEPGGEIGSVMCWRTDDNSLLLQQETGTPKVVDVEFLPDTAAGHVRMVAIDASGRLHLIESPLAAAKTQSNFSSSVVSEGPFVRCVFDRINSCLWLGGRDGAVSRMSDDGRIELVFQPYEKAIFAIETFPTGSAIVTVCQDRRVTVSTTAGKQRTKLRPEFPVREVAVSPDERYLAICGETRKILLFDMQEHTQFELAGHFAKVLAIRFSRDGTRLFSASEDDTVRLWETESWQEVFSSESSGGWIVDIDLNEDDSRLYGACTGHSIATWQSLRD